jgi:PAS domain S-box-containing protein
MKMKQSDNYITIDHEEESNKTIPQQQTPFASSLANNTPRSFWQDMRCWWASTTFVPRFLSGPWRHPILGYLAALILQTASVRGIALLSPSFHFPGSITLLIVLLIAYGWGAGAAFFATVVGALALVYWIVPPHGSFTLGNIEDFLGIIIYSIGGLTIAVLISQLRRARTLAEVEMSKQVHAREQVEALVNALEAEKQALHESEERSRLITELVSDYAYAFRVAPDGKAAELAWMTEAVERITGFSTDEWERRGWEHFFHPDDQHLIMERRAVLRAGKPDIRDWRVYTRSGEYRWLRDYCRPVADPQSGQLAWLYGAAQDITERKQAEMLVEQQASELQAIIEAVPDAIYFTDQQGRNIRMNSAGNKLLGLDTHPNSNWTGKKLGSYLKVQDEQGHELPLEQWPSSRILHGEVISHEKSAEVILHTLDGQTIFASITGGPVFDAEQKLVGAVTVLRDVSEHRKLMYDLAANATQLDSIFEAMTDGVVFYDAHGRVLRKNQAYSNMIGLDNDPAHIQLTPRERGEMLDLRDEQGKPLSDQQQPVQRMLSGEVFVAGKTMDIQLRALNGSHKQLNITGTALYDQAHNLTGGVLIFRDVTDRRMLERQTQETLEALLTMAEELVKLPDQDENTDRQMEASVEIAQRLVKLICQVMSCKRVGITAYDERTQILRLLATSGLSTEETRYMQEEVPGSRLSELLQGTPFANAIRSQDVVMVDFNQSPLRDRLNLYGIHTMLLVPMKIGSRLVGVISLDHGSEDHYYTENERTLAKAIGDLVALIIERESLLAQRAEAYTNELAAREATTLMEEFLGIAGHELRTPLTTIKAGIQLSKRHISRLQAKNGSLTEDVSSTVEAIQGLLIRTERQVGLQNRLINDLLDVSRIQTGKLELHPELIDIAQLVQQVVEDQHDLTPERTLHYTSTTPGEHLIFADTDRLRQVITNYLSNALKYSAADKPVDVQVSSFEHSVRVSVTDEGAGLTIEQQQRVWERFYRVPGVEVKSGSSVGLGLGLHISRMIIERQGGRVGVESTPGQGSTFWFTLPLAE